MALNFNELKGYGEWSTARCLKGEDPRDLGAFARHLEGLGADYTDLRRYGVPDITAPPVPAVYRPQVVDFLVPAQINGLAVIQGKFAATPKGVILHGSESGSTTNTVYEEWVGTCKYVQKGALRFTKTGEPYYVSWNATIGEDIVGRHMKPGTWGWNAGEESALFIGVELAHARTVLSISDAQVNALAWYIADECRGAFPTMPLFFPLHSELPQGISVGKVDLYPRGSVVGNDFRKRLMVRLTSLGVH